MTVLLIRHAVAKDRHQWDDDDDLRPLTKRGRAQADSLLEQLAGYAIDRVYSSPSLRCVETVSPLAEARRLTVDTDDRLAEGSGRQAIEWVRSLVTEGANVALCSHGDVIPEVLDALGYRWRFKCAKGSTWALAGDDAMYLSPPA